MVTTDGKVIGEHAGVHNFTVGQRKGLGVATGSPLYVIQIKNDTRQVVVGKDEELYSRTLRARRVNLISTAELREPMRVAVKIRHKHQPAPAIIEVRRARRSPSYLRRAAARDHSRPGRRLLRRRHRRRRRLDRELRVETRLAASPPRPKRRPPVSTGYWLPPRYLGLLLHRFIALSWPRPADEAELGLVHDGTFVVSPR